MVPSVKFKVLGGFTHAGDGDGDDDDDDDVLELRFVSGSVSVGAVEVVPLVHHGVPAFQLSMVNWHLQSMSIS